MKSPAGYVLGGGGYGTNIHMEIWHVCVQVYRRGGGGGVVVEGLSGGSPTGLFTGKERIKVYK